MSDVEARREARRRKILENAEKRLNKITGLEQRNVSYELEGYKVSRNTHIEENTFEDSTRDVSTSTSSINHKIHLHQENGICDPPLANISPESAIKTLTPQLVYLKTHRIPIIVFMALLINVVLATIENQHLHFVNKIFIPVLALEAIDILYNAEQINESVSFLGLFLKLPKEQLMRISKCLSILRTVFRDISIYFFSFICLLYLRDLFTNTLYIMFVS